MVRRTIPFMRHALVFNVISLITFIAAVFFLGVFMKRTNAKGCLSALVVGFALGAFRLLMPDGSTHVSGEVLEWSPPHRLCVTWRVAGMKDFSELPECLISYEVVQAGGRRGLPHQHPQVEPGRRRQALPPRSHRLQSSKTCKARSRAPSSWIT